MTTIDTPRLDEAALEQFVNQAVGDLAAAISGLMVHLGDRLGLYRAMAGSGPMTPTDLAERTGTHERYVREWLSNQAAGGCSGPATRRTSRSPGSPPSTAWWTS
jgi:Rv2258c-like winged HTH domain